MPPHTCQDDGVNCGVFVMWYAYQIAHKNSITDPLVPADFRQKIFKMLAGNCMQREQYSDENCRVCGNSKLLAEWVQCGQCNQLFHCQCVNLPFVASRAENLKFVCP